MTQDIERILNVVKEEGLSKAMLYYSSFICSSPKKHFSRKGMFSKQNAGLRIKNVNYGKELTQWKKNKLFPFFLEHGFTKEQIKEAWNKSIFAK
jgi:hypothetical protein